MRVFNHLVMSDILHPHGAQALLLRASLCMQMGSADSFGGRGRFGVDSGTAGMLSGPRS